MCYEITPNMLLKLWFERNALSSRYPLNLNNISAQNNKWFEGFMYKIDFIFIYIYIRIYLVDYMIRRPSHSAEIRRCRIYTGNETVKLAYYCVKIISFVMRQRRFGTEHVYCSNVTIWYQWKDIVALWKYRNFWHRNDNSLHTIQNI